MKNSGIFLAWAEPDPKNSIFRVFTVSTVLRTYKLITPKPVVPIESRDSEGVPFASLESL